MLNITIPGVGELAIKHVVFDFNGTLATDGKLRPSLVPLLAQLKAKAKLYVLSADTYGSVREECGDLGLEVRVLSSKNGAAEKRAFVRERGAETTVCVGNGVNDAGMFEICALSLLIMGEEGCAVKTFAKADIIVKNSEDALNLLLHPQRITATLRA